MSIRRLTLAAFVFAAALAPSVARAQLSTTPSFFSVDARASFLRTGPFDSPAAPTVIDLGTGLNRVLTLQAIGTYRVAGGGPTQNAGFLMVFSASPILLANNGVLDRVQDAIDIGAPYTSTAFSRPSFYGGVPMDITQDFFVGAAGLTLNVPTAARYLFIGVPDDHFADNSSPDPANFGVLASQITTVPEPGTTLLLSVGLVMTGVMARSASRRRRIV